MSEPTPTTPHGPHPTVPGKLILLITAVGCVVLFFYADSLYRLLGPVAGLP